MPALLQVPLAWAMKKMETKIPAPVGMLLTLASIAFGQPSAMVLYAQAVGV